MEIKNCIKIDLENFEKWLKRESLSLKTIKSYISDIKNSLKNFSNNEITLKELESFKKNEWRALIANLSERNASAKTQQRYIAAWRKWTKFKEENKVNIEFNQINMPKVNEYSPPEVKEEDIKKLLNFAPKNWKEKRLSALIYLLYGTGMRINEAINLKWKDLNEKYCKVFGKGSKIRYVPILPRVKNKIEEYEISLPEKSSFIFCNLKFEKWHASTIERDFKKIVLKLNLPDITPHSLRHACATHLLKSGCDLKTIQDLLGHSSLEITKLYIKYSEKELFEIHQKALNF